jgi:hypothetical protein
MRIILCLQVHFLVKAPIPDQDDHPNMLPFMRKLASVGISIQEYLESYNGAEEG